MISVEIKSCIIPIEPHNIIVGHRFGSVLMNIDGSTLEFKTPEAFKLGWEITTKSGAMLDRETLCVKINNKEIYLGKEQGLKIGGGLLRKCDDADDFQIGVAK